MRVPAPEDAGLCSNCVHAKVIVSDRGARYTQCRRALTDPQFEKYPRLPVLQCVGFEPRGPDLAPRPPDS